MLASFDLEAIKDEVMYRLYCVFEFVLKIEFGLVAAFMIGMPASRYANAQREYPGIGGELFIYIGAFYAVYKLTGIVLDMIYGE